MKKIIFHKFETLIYPVDLFVSVGANISSIKDHFEIDSSDEFGYMEHLSRSNCVGVVVEDKKTNTHGILMNFKSKKDMSVSTIAHESVHFADYVFETIGAFSQSFSDKNEQYAYLVGWAAECMNKVKTNKLFKCKK